MTTTFKTTTTVFQFADHESAVEAEARAIKAAAAAPSPVAEGTLARFLEYAEDADNWSGEPLVGGNVGGDPADRGYLVNMKKAGLIVTQRDEGCVWLQFTAKGRALAAEHGINLR